MLELLYIEIVFLFLFFRLYNADWQCTSTDFQYKMDGEVMIIDEKKNNDVDSSGYGLKYSWKKKEKKKK